MKCFYTIAAALLCCIFHVASSNLCEEQSYTIVTLTDGKVFCKFLDGSQCPLTEYNDRQCVSDTEKKAIAKFKAANADNTETSSYSDYYASEKSWIPDITKPLDPGFAMASLPRFGYDVKKQKCRKFIFGGVPVVGNDNIFETMNECEQMVHVYKLYSN